MIYIKAIDTDGTVWMFCTDSIRDVYEFSKKVECWEYIRLEV